VLLSCERTSVPGIWHVYHVIIFDGHSLLEVIMTLSINICWFNLSRTLKTCVSKIFVLSLLVELRHSSRWHDVQIRVVSNGVSHEERVWRHRISKARVERKLRLNNSSSICVGSAQLPLVLFERIINRLLNLMELRLVYVRVLSCPGSLESW